MKQNNFVLVIFTILFVVVIALLVFFVLKPGSFISIITGKLPQSYSVGFEQISLDNRNIFSFPVEFTSLPQNLVSYQADAFFIGDPYKRKISIFLGTEDGNIRAGTCMYDESQKKFTGVATWKLMDTKDFTKLVNIGTKAQLRFYTPGSTFDSFLNSNKYLSDLVTELNKGISLSKEYLLVADQICVSN